jgi:hypothetical protein
MESSSCGSRGDPAVEQAANMLGDSSQEGSETDGAAASEAENALQMADVLLIVFEQLGMLSLCNVAAACQCWASAAATARLQWRVLRPVGTIHLVEDMDRTDWSGEETVHDDPVGCKFVAPLPDGGICVTLSTAMRRRDHQPLLKISAAHLFAPTASLTTSLTECTTRAGAMLPKGATLPAGIGTRFGAGEDGPMGAAAHLSEHAGPCFTPMGVCVDGDSLFVCETDLDRVHKLAWADGASIAMTLGGEGGGNGGGRGASLNFPSGCAVFRRIGRGETQPTPTSPKSLAVVDRLNHRVMLFDAESAPLLHPQTAIGRRRESGSSADHLNRPSDVAAFGGRLYVTDLGNDRVCCYALMAPPLPPSFRYAIGSRGTKPGQFLAPCGIAVLTMGSESGGGEGQSAHEGHGPWCGGSSPRARLLVGEHEGKRVQVLSLHGTPLQVVAFPNCGPLTGLCVSGAYAFVADDQRSVLWTLRLAGEAARPAAGASCGAAANGAAAGAQAGATKRAPEGCPRAALPYCAACGLAGRGGTVGLKRCPCRACCYCGTECQRADWARHKRVHADLCKAR